MIKAAGVFLEIMLAAKIYYFKRRNMLGEVLTYTIKSGISA